MPEQLKRMKTTVVHTPDTLADSVFKRFATLARDLAGAARGMGENTTVGIQLPDGGFVAMDLAGNLYAWGEHVIDMKQAQKA